MNSSKETSWIWYWSGLHRMAWICSIHSVHENWYLYWITGYQCLSSVIKLKKLDVYQMQQMFELEMISQSSYPKN